MDVGSRGRPRSLRHKAGVTCAVWALAFSLLAVVSALPGPPTAVLTVDDATPFVGETVRFDASSSVAHDMGNGAIAAYRFVFGDEIGTEWQASPFADHAYASPGVRSASVVVQDLRGYEGQASVDVDVRVTPPPTGVEPDLAILAATPTPARPRVDDLVLVGITVLNRGGTTAQSATVLVTDERPSGAWIPIDSIALPGPLAPGGMVVLTTDSFPAIEIGDHRILIEIRDVQPAEIRTADNVRTEPMTVRPAGTPVGDGLPVNPLLLVLIGAATITFFLALVLLTRPSPKDRTSDPSPAAPSDWKPPPVWPP